MATSKRKNVNEEQFALNYFNQLKLQRWQISGNTRQGGQAKTIEVRDQQKRVQGVFRVLYKETEAEKKRFRRELEVLLSISHPNVVEILDYSKNPKQLWYVSKRGAQFKTFWEKRRNRLKSDPDALLFEAIGILRGITSGLELIHHEDMVHRDIKSSNIVMNGKVPVLIDFGIVFVKDKERITSLDRAVANKFSHDLALSHMETVPKWLDVFLLAQLLIWMVSERTDKNIERPLDWRFVDYPKFSEENQLRVLALTGQCSDPLSSPKDATELKMLLETLFPISESSVVERDNIEEVKTIIRNAFSEQLVGHSGAWRSIESRMATFRVICDEIESKLKAVIDNLTDVHGLKITLREPSSFIDDFSKKVFESAKKLPAHISAGFTYQLGEGLDHSYSFSVVYQCYTSIGIKDHPAYTFAENKPLIRLHLYDDYGGKLNNPKVQLVEGYNVVPDDMGKLRLYRVHSEDLGPTTIDNLIDKIYECMVNKEAWRLILE